MPNPKEMQPQKLSVEQDRIAAGIPPMFGQTPNYNLSSEIAALRLEISELRAALMPVPSLILTGQQALDEFRRLNGGKP